MLFDYDLTVTKGTSKFDPVEQAAKLSRGKLTEIRVLFPPGPATLVHVIVLDRLHQLMPANPDGSLNFDDAVLVSKMDYELTDSPYELRLIGWSPDAVYDHTITFQFELEPVTGQSWEDFNRVLFDLNVTDQRR